MDETSFTALLGAVFEKSPWVAAGAWKNHPFENIETLHESMVNAVKCSSLNQQLELLRAHPELAGQEARAGALTTASESEQTGAGLKSLTAAEMIRITELNDAYNRRFGHPFIIAVGKRDKKGIFSAFEQRLSNDAATELATALDEVFTIARLRLEKMFNAPANGLG